ncbi:hypothetical protein [Clostridium tertium]|uniref:hypothetical protein n=1 Tax=Clostridium tertium TaxID=1559 RepID=UPI0023B22BE2|nr:hypothetical protein [Clostridium tertium]
MIYEGDDLYFPQYLDINGRPVKRTKDEYPYSYDPYVIWDSGLSREKSHTLYSDRLMQWNCENFNECCMVIWGNRSQYFSDRKPNDIESFLSMYLDKPAKLVLLMEGCNHASGYPYWIFYYE